MKGDPAVDILMQPVERALMRHGITNTAKTDIYNRAYEAVVTSMDVIDTLHEQLSAANARAEAAERGLVEMRERIEGVCHWKLEDEESSVWFGDCGVMWELRRGSPKDNEMAYCPKCGKRLEQVYPPEYPPEVEE